MYSLLSITFLFFTTTVSNAVATSRPIVGILSQDINTTMSERIPGHSTYIGAQYVKAVESSGARVVPVAVSQPESYYRHLLGSINGILLPGGAAHVHRGNSYYETVNTIHKIAREINDGGVIFPILAVCLGMEILLTVSNEHQNILQRCSIFHQNLPLIFTPEYENSKQFRQLSSELKTALEQENITMNWHSLCVFREDFEKSSLVKNWRITSVSQFSGVTFVSSTEHINYPFFGVQFHPEKAPFDWHTKNNRDVYPHSRNAIEVSRFFYDGLVSYATENNNRFENSTEEFRSLIYNYPVTYTAATETETQIYFDLPFGNGGDPVRSAPFVIVFFAATWATSSYWFKM